MAIARCYKSQKFEKVGKFYVPTCPIFASLVTYIYVTGFHITRLPHTQNQTYDFTRNGLLV